MARFGNAVWHPPFPDFGAFSSSNSHRNSISDPHASPRRERTYTEHDETRSGFRLLRATPLHIELHGIVQTLNLSSLTFGTSYDLGGSLNGMDVARDNSFLLVAQDSIGPAQGSFQKVDLATG